MRKVQQKIIPKNEYGGQSAYIPLDRSVLFSTFDQNFDFKIRIEHKNNPMSTAPMSR